MKKYFLALILGVQAISLSAQEVKNVILISIDGFRPNFYTEERYSTVTLKMLAKKGMYADQVRTIFPSVTYPSHTTLTTGVFPAKHGIYYNTTIGENGDNEGWVYDFKEVKAPTIWEAAKKKGLITASVSWPVTVNNPFIDYNIPEIWSFDNPSERRDATSKYANPKGLYEEVVKAATGEMEMKEFNLQTRRMDQNLGRIASHIIKKYHPNLLTLHLPITDGAQHSVGREGLEVERAIAGADQAIATIIETLEQEKMMENTAIIVTGDHGFVSTHTSIAANLWLKEKGLSDKAFFFSTGGSAFLHLKNKNDKKTTAQVREMLNNLPFAQKQMFRIISDEQMKEFQPDPNAVLAITAEDGYSFSNKKDGDLFSKAPGGKHGYFPDFFNIYTGFIGSGAGFKPGSKVHQIGLEDVPAIIASLLKLDYLNESQARIKPILK